MALQLNIDAMVDDCPPSYAINADASVVLRAYLLQRNGVYTHDGHALSTLTEDAIDFTSKRAVGKGASGHVYYATLKGSGTPVALKEIVIEDKQHRDEIHRELAVLLSKYDSTFVIRNYGAFWSVTDGCVTLAMEWMAFSLEDLIRTHRGLPEEALKSVALQAVCGLQYLHDVKRVIHRDIKPHNLLIGAGGEVKLSDFGVSKVLETMQRPQTYVGTMLFMAPERLQDEPYDVSSDVWSLGVTLVAASNGRNPWSPPEDVTLFTLLRKLAGEDTPKLAPTFSEEAHSFVNACLQRSPDARMTCRQLRQHPFLTSTTLDEARVTMKQVVTLTMRMLQTSE